MALRWNGSMIGKDNVPTPTSPAFRGGIWPLGAGSAFRGNLVEPSQLADLALWLDGQGPFYDATTGGSLVTAAGNAVARWEDKSPNALHYTQGTANNRPLLVSGGGLDFDGSNDQLQATNGSNALFEKAEYTLFILFDADAFTGAPVLMRFDAQNTTDQLFELDTQVTTLAYIGATSSFRTYPTSGNLTLSASNKYLFNFTRTFDASGALRIDNTSYTTFTGSLASLAVRQNQTATLAAYANNLYFNGKIYEVIMYSRALTSDERVMVQTYLNNKWSYV
jgi:hypothetical protein